jgi:CTD kinase subunit gamma
LLAPEIFGKISNVQQVITGLQEKNILRPTQVQELWKSLDKREEEANFEIAQPLNAMQLDRIDGINDLDEKDVEQRMEEDRERHKRTREDTWAVDPDTELDQLYESGTAGLTAKLLQDCADDAKARKLAIALDEMNYRSGTTV